jgi:hypothetical protein
MNAIRLGLLIALILVLAGCSLGGEPSDEVSLEEAQETVDAYNDLMEDSTPDHRVRGSCNTIDDQSVCVDFTGEAWDEEKMKLQCNGVGTFSLDACPYTELGGCISGVDSLLEQIIWMYSTGGSPITAEEASYAEMSCNAVSGGRWTNPQIELQRRQQL